MKKNPGNIFKDDRVDVWSGGAGRAAGQPGRLPHHRFGPGMETFHLYNVDTKLLAFFISQIDILVPSVDLLLKFSEGLWVLPFEGLIRNLVSILFFYIDYKSFCSPVARLPLPGGCCAQGGHRDQEDLPHGRDPQQRHRLDLLYPHLGVQIFFWATEKISTQYKLVFYHCIFTIVHLKNPCNYLTFNMHKI